MTTTDEDERVRKSSAETHPGYLIDEDGVVRSDFLTEVSDVRSNGAIFHSCSRMSSGCTNPNSATSWNRCLPINVWHWCDCSATTST